jgi:rhodanese-related sulfurtransferase
VAGPDVLRLYALVRGVAQERVAGVEPRRVAYLRLAGERAAEHGLTREELAERSASGTVTVLDVRPREEFAAGHLPGAFSIPLEELEARLAELPADSEVVAYCRGAYCVMAYDAVDLLRAHGVTACRLEDGMLEWRLAGMAVESGPAA